MSALDTSSEFSNFLNSSEESANSLILRIGLLILLALAAFTFALYHLIGQPTINRLTKSQMELAAQQLEGRFTSLIRTVEVTLRSSQGWGRAAATGSHCGVRWSWGRLAIMG